MSVNSLFLQATAPVSLSPVLLFRVDLVDELLRLCVGIDWERRPYPPRALWAFESIQSPRFVPICDGFWFRFRFWCTRLRRFHEFFAVIPVLLAIS